MGSVGCGGTSFDSKESTKVGQCAALGHGGRASDLPDFLRKRIQSDSKCTNLA